MNTDGFLKSLNSVTVFFLSLFFVSEVIAISLGILVVMPKLPQFQKEDQNIDGISNPLFFGAFAEFEEDKYLDYLEKNLACNSSATRFLAKDIYQGGMVLSDKYRKLRNAYRYALIGFILLMLTFLSYHVV